MVDENEVNNYYPFTQSQVEAFKKFIRKNGKGLLFCFYLAFLTFCICHSIHINSGNSSDRDEINDLDSTLSTISSQISALRH